MDNRRTSPRVRTAIRGHIQAHNRQVSAHIRNLSEKGALVLVDMPLLPDTEIRLIFTPKSGNRAGTEFRAEGAAVWCIEDMDAGYQSGIRFDRMDEDSRAVLKSLLRSASGAPDSSLE